MGKSNLSVLARRIDIGFISLLLVFSWGCSESQDIKEARATMDRANSLMDSAPEEAMTVLDSVDQSVLGERDLYRLKLLKIKANDKAYVTHTSDSAYLEVFDYFSLHPDDELYGEVLYYGGRVYDDLGDKPRALAYFQESLDVLGEEDMSPLKTAVLSQTGGLLSNMRMQKEAIPYLEECIKISEKTGDSTYLHYDYELLASVYSKMKDYVSAESNYLKAMAIAKKIAPSEIISLRGDLATLKFRAGDNDSALILIRGVPEQTNDLSKNYYKSYACEIYYRAGIYDSAYMYAHDIKDGEEYDLRPIGYEILLKPELRKYYPEDTLNLYLSRYLRTLEDKYNTNDSEGVIMQNSRYNYSIYERRNRELTASRQRVILWFLASCSVIFLMIVVILWLRYRHLRQTNRLREMLSSMKRLNSMKESETLVRTDFTPISHSELTDEIRKEIIKLKAKSGDADTNPFVGSDGYRIAEKLLAAGKVLGEGSREWKSIVRSFESVAPTFRSDIEFIGQTRLSDRDYHLLILMKYGFSNTDISKIMGRVRSTVSHRSRQLCEKIFFGIIEPGDLRSVLAKMGGGREKR